MVQVVIASLDMTELSTVLDYLLTTILLGMLVIFQPELRRGLMMLGRSKLWRYFNPSSHSLAERLADAATLLARDKNRRSGGYSGGNEPGYVCRNGRADRCPGIVGPGADPVLSARAVARRRSDPGQWPDCRRRLPASAG